MGVQHTFIRVTSRPLDYTVTAAGAVDPWLAGTGLNAGDTVAGVVGREHDALNPYPPSCIHPALTVLFHYDGGGVDQNADAVRFTAPSGARVFASGAQQFAWALDGWRSDGSLFSQPPVDQGLTVQVDPRLQMFVRNALDDLTRPAPPTAVAALVEGPNLVVTVAPASDPRVVGFVAVVRTGGHWVRLCRGRTQCAGAQPPGTGPLTVGAVAVDVWRRRSAAAFALAQR
jgi:hypothetical protein